MTDARPLLSAIARLTKERDDYRDMCRDFSGAESPEALVAALRDRARMEAEIAGLKAELAAAEAVTRKTLQSIPVAMDAVVAGACKVLEPFARQNTGAMLSFEELDLSDGDFDAARAYIAKHAEYADRHASAVAAAVAEEREACARALAKLCPDCGGAEWLWAHEISGVGSTTDDTKYGCRGTEYREHCQLVAAIRARGTEGGR
jgi:hypothetical protein